MAPSPSSAAATAEALHVVCPHCATTNRVPAARLGGGGKCGACHKPLFTGHPVEMDGAALSRRLGAEDLPLLLDCWASWCGPCRTMAPEFETAAGMLEPAVRLGKLDTERNPEAARRLGIQSIPTLILFHRGRELGRLSGARPGSQIVAWTRDQLARAGAAA